MYKFRQGISMKSALVSLTVSADLYHTLFPYECDSSAASDDKSETGLSE